MQDDESWIIALPKHIADKNQLYLMGHEVTHIYLDNTPESKYGNMIINYKAEYDADFWSYKVL